jgi:hypothetical protein
MRYRRKFVCARDSSIKFPRGRFAEAASQFNIVLEQDPLNVLFRSAFGWVLAFAGQPDRALAGTHKAVEIDSNLWMTHCAATLGYAVHQTLQLRNAQALSLIGLLFKPRFRPRLGFAAESFPLKPVQLPTADAQFQRQRADVLTRLHPFPCCLTEVLVILPRTAHFLLLLI